MPDESELIPEASEQRFACPGCGEEVEVAADAVGQLVRCPYCNTEFFASREAVNQAVVDDTIEPETPSDDQAKLDNLKISQLTALRRGAIRARSWCLITVVVCLVGAIQLVIKTVQNVRHEHRWGWRPTGFVVAAIAGLWIARFFYYRARELKREIDTPVQTDPVTPPDLSTLGDGTQRWKDLEQL